MWPWITQVQRKWTASRVSLAVPGHYRVTCPCGQIMTGSRLPVFQAISCTKCGQAAFVLPRSPLPPILSDSPVKSGLRLTSVRDLVNVLRRSPWRIPFLAGGLTLALLITAIILAFSFSSRSRPNSAKPADIAKHSRAGREALALGNFNLAASEFNAASALRERFPDALSLTERRQLTQWHRQASLLTALLSVSLEEIVRTAAELQALDEREWKAVFADRYKGRSVVFDDTIRREASGSYQMLGYSVFLRGKPARIELSDLQMMRSLPLESPRRMLFGARLADVRLEAEGIWVIHLEPASGVLITDASTAYAVLPIPPEELREVLQRQTGWAEDLR